ncbi:hypothetical protein KKH13_00700 [Patescibacteria group bacterium]|nr:hypothetical protein [Patescibacteria group bacterium]
MAVFPETEQNRVINTGKAVDIPIGYIHDVLGVPTIFSGSNQFSFHMIDLDEIAFRRLVPKPMVREGIKYKQTLVLGKNEVALLAICQGENKSLHLDNNLPVATVFNLNTEPSLDLVMVDGSPLNNETGGFDVSRLLQPDINNADVLKINEVGSGVTVEIFSLEPGV